MDTESSPPTPEKTPREKALEALRSLALDEKAFHYDGDILAVQGASYAATEGILGESRTAVAKLLTDACKLIPPGETRSAVIDLVLSSWTQATPSIAAVEAVTEGAPDDLKDESEESSTRKSRSKKSKE